MKKQLLNLSACAVLLALASIAFADPLVPPVRVLEIPYAGQSGITIDGAADAVYSAVQSTDAFNSTGSTGADADYTFSFKVAYNTYFLYIYGEILDDYDNSLEYTTDDNQWTYDCIEIFINLDTVSLSPAYDTNTIQLRINRGIDSIQSPGRATQEEYIHHWENTATGWLFETAIPWTCVLGNGQVPEDMQDYLDAVHGFDVSGTDSDTPGPDWRDCQTAWDPDDPDDFTEDSAWNDRTVFGIVTLMGGGSPPPSDLPYIQPVKNMNTPLTPYQMNVDGYDNELYWGDAQNLDIFNTHNWESPADLSGYFKTAWDYENLYIFAEITDDNNQSWDGFSDPSLFDNLEVYIDLDTLCDDIYYRSNSTAMLRFCRGVDEVESTGRALPEDFQYSWRNKVQGGGWFMEAAIPWEAAMATGANPEDIAGYLPVIGFDVILNDRDTEIPADRYELSQAGWDLDEGNYQENIVENNATYNTRTFGIVNLSSGSTGLSNNNVEDKVTLSPVPASEVIYFRKLDNVLRLEIMNLQGKVVLTVDNPESELSLDISRFEKGIYIARYIKPKTSSSLKFIVE